MPHLSIKKVSVPYGWVRVVVDTSPLLGAVSLSVDRHQQRNVDL